MKRELTVFIVSLIFCAALVLNACDPQAAVQQTPEPAATAEVQPSSTPVPKTTSTAGSAPEPSAQASEEPTQTAQPEKTTEPTASEAPAASSAQPEQPTGSTVQLSIADGSIQGLQTDNISTYKGIPYAKPPVGDLRFAPPEDVEPWTDVLDCTQFGPTPVQVYPREDQPMSEDCLTVNVWTPAQAADEKLPVYVWIYGGAFAQGAGSESSYDGTNFAKDGIVTVTFNYRVNALGFFATQETYNQYGTTGNWGILDQIKALEWVQENIAAFGGDPSRVTVGGESAGSYCVSALIVSPLAEGLFQGAIMESGSILGVPGNTAYARGDLQRSAEVCNMMAYEFGAADNIGGLQKMRGADADILAQLCPLTVDFTTTPAFMMMPVYDGYVMPVDVYGALQAGQFNKANLLWGFNADEGSIFVPADTTQEKYEMLASRMYGYDQSKLVLERFPADAEHTSGDRARQVFAHGMFTTVMKPFGDALADSGQNVYAYNFNYVTAQGEEAGLGASHGSEIEYTFGNTADPGADQQKLTDEMHTRWVNFITYGDPNGEGGLTVEWPKYDTQNNQVLAFDKEVTVEPISDIEDRDFMEDIMFGENGTY